ncbi:alpha/beta-hydrolase [Cucurbitaria berberidis CBS 394.84]|uniref:Alpha/beta-hydrolase n=1 Tax=Cucurbitaria berberidis CBS 394.84 TaxID=1168544 RepID=A0A9P4GCP0_9PLEO|nr:alpha/beta-hydrolase [Cucurbitaria berberidis CBS 394.84]KAF1843463.1 alpha/beta-hydrolase [Cucurbitaria berberidis CBS 394.84]
MSDTTHPNELVLVPGSFAYSALYEPLITPLRAKGLIIHALDPPCFPASYKKGTPSPSMYDDAAFINAFVTKLAEEGKDIVLLAHSYGGTPATESLKGVTKKEREAQGKKGGVVRVAYLTAIVPKIGEHLAQVISAAAQGGAPPIEIDEDGWMFQPRPDLTAAIVYNSLSPERGTAEAAKFGKHASISFGTNLTHNGYKDVPVSWFFCEDDLCVVPEVQETAINVIEESWKGTERQGKKVDVTRVKCDHIPIHSASEELEKWVEGIIAKGGKE